MDKNAIIAGVRQALEAQDCPCENIEGQPGLQWFWPLTDDYENHYAVGELFFASDLTQDDMNGVDVAQTNLVFLRGVPQERLDALRAFFARVNRLLSGGRFDAQQEESGFAEYGHDLILPDDLTDAQCVKAIVTALDLARAYIGFVYEGACGVAAGDLTPEMALESVYD